MSRRSFSSRICAGLRLVVLLPPLVALALQAHAMQGNARTPETSELSEDVELSRSAKTLVREALIDKPGAEARIPLEMSEPGTVLVSFGADVPDKGLEAEIFDPLGESLGKTAAFNFIPGTVEIVIRDRWGRFARPEPVPVTLELKPEADPLEPNRVEHPATIRLNAWYDNVLIPSDTDYFVFDVPRPGRLIIEYAGRKNPLDMAWRALDSDRWTGGGLFAAEASGRYMLRLAHRYGSPETEPFRFRVAWVPGLSEEPRDLQLNMATPAVIPHNDAFERFTLKVPEPGLLTLSVMGPAPESTTIRLKRGEDAMEGPEVRRTVEAGTYEVLVFTRYSRSSPRTFHLLANLYKTTDTDEPNDRRETATEVKLGEPVRVTLFPESDTDWFRYEISEEGFLTFLIETGWDNRHRAMRSLKVFKETGEGLEPVTVPTSATPHSTRAGPFPVSPGVLYVSSYVKYREMARLDFTMTPDFLPKREADKGNQVFVIGLSLGDDAKAKMATLTNSTGGVYVDAESTEVLKTRVEEVKRRAEKEARRRTGSGSGWIWLLAVLAAAGGTAYFYRRQLADMARTYAALLRPNLPGG